MLILIANAGSSSLKCQLLDMPSEKVIARAKVERIGDALSPIEWTERNGTKKQAEVDIPDCVSAIRFVLERLSDPNTGTITSLEDLAAVVGETVVAKGFSGCHLLNDEVIAGMIDYSSVVMPMHNPIYVDAIESFRKLLPTTPMVGLFEDFFFDRLPDYAAIYPIPWDWTQKHGIRRLGYHSASHYYMSRRLPELMGCDIEAINAITCHLGGSSSLSPIRAGIAVDNSFGFTGQTGIPLSVRSSDMDPFIIPFLVSRGEGDVEHITHRMMTDAGLAAISGMGFDFRDLEKAASDGHERARLAIDMYVHGVRKYLGAYMIELGHVDAIVMAGGTGEASPYIRKLILWGLDEFGIDLDDAGNNACMKSEARISAESSRIQVWVVPTDEEIIVARQAYQLLLGK
ncbi:MAG: acetate/propionate family kinase [Armatimonadetes bacterium]|nr:acetate/propionate family kinase [Armatimonadota bacterium]